MTHTFVDLRVNFEPCNAEDLAQKLHIKRAYSLILLADLESCPSKISAAVSQQKHRRILQQNLSIFSREDFPLLCKLLFCQFSCLLSADFKTMKKTVIHTIIYMHVI